MKEKLDNLGSTLEQLQTFMVNSGNFKGGEVPLKGGNKPCNLKGKQSTRGKDHSCTETAPGRELSDTTIYQSAVEFQDQSDNEITFNFAKKQTKLLF